MKQISMIPEFPLPDEVPPTLFLVIHDRIQNRSLMQSFCFEFVNIRGFRCKVRKNIKRAINCG
ncbi:hypothetical protein ACT7DJ_14075 [Bacillus cereus]